MQNEELVKLIQEGKDVPENQYMLYKQNKSIFRNWIKPLSNSSVSVDADDLLQECYFGMLKAVEKFDVEKGYKFLTFAKYEIRNHCIRYIQTSGTTKRLPVHIHERIIKYKKVINDYGYIPNDETLRKEMNLTTKQLKDLKSVISEGSCISLDAATFEDSDVNICDLIPDAENIEENFILKERNKELWEAVQELEEPKRNVIIEKYMNGETFVNISNKFKEPIHHVRKIEGQALKELHKMDKVRSLVDKYDYETFRSYHNNKSLMDKGEGSSVEQIAINKIELEERMKIIGENLQNVMNGII